MEKISIIIPVYNVEKYIARCLDSVRQQTWQNLEIICIDDGSEDESGAICDEFAAKDDRFVVLHQGNGGAAAARNAGLDRATGDYIGFVDGDDWIEPEMFEIMIQKAIMMDADICASGFVKEGYLKSWRFVDEDIEQNVPFSGEQALRYAFARYLYKSFANYNWSKLFKAELIRGEADNPLRYDVGLKVCEDTFFFAQAAMRAEKITYVAKAFYHYDQREDSLMHDKNYQDRYCHLTAYQRIIDLMEAAHYSEGTVKWAKRFYVYHAGVILEMACRIKDYENIARSQKAIEKYLKEYEETSGGHEAWNERMRRMLTEPFKVAEEAKIKEFDAQQEFYTENLLLPVFKKHIFYEASYSKGMLCGPYGLFKAFMRRVDFEEYVHIWAIQSQADIIRFRKRYSQYKNVVFVLRGSKEYLKYLARCQIFINNITLFFYFHKREEQILLNTWHGIPMKHIGYDVPDGIYSAHNNFRNFLIADFISSWNPFMTKVYREAYKLEGIFTGEIIEEGSARSDLTFRIDQTEFFDRLEEVGIRIERNKKIILFAPTWRGNNFSFPDFNGGEIMRFMEMVAEQTNQNKYQVLFKPHQAVYKYVERDERMRPYSIPPAFDANEVLSVTDVLISDYSSIYFDFLITGRPIIFYINDLNSYKDYRGLYFGLEKLPGPVAATAEAVAFEINHLADYHEKYGEKYQAMTAWTCNKDDGHVGERILEIVLDQNRSGKAVYSDFKTNQKKVLVLFDKMMPNARTEELLSSLFRINNELYDITLIVREPKTEEEKEQMRRIPLHVRTLARVNTFNVTAKERELLKREMESEVQREAGTVPSAGGSLAAEEEESLARIFRREYRRCVGVARFDYYVNGDEENPFTSLFCRFMAEGAKRSFAELR